MSDQKPLRQAETMDQQRQQQARHQTAQLLAMLRAAQAPPSANIAQGVDKRQTARARAKRATGSPQQGNFRPAVALGVAPPKRTWRSLQQTVTRPRGQFATLVEQARALQRYNEAFHDCLPLHMKDRAHLVVSQQGWVVFAESSSWATRLRYLLPNVRHQLIQRLKFNVPQLQIKVNPCRRSVTLPTYARARAVTHQSVSAITAAAEQASDPRLRRALERLAQRVEHYSVEELA